MITAIKIFTVIIAFVILASLVMIFIKRYRKAGLQILGSLVIIFVITGICFFYPKKYDRIYLKKAIEWKSLSFRQYADSLNFYIGAIPGSAGIPDPLFCQNFNSVTPANALKMGPLLKNQKIGEYDFSDADKIVNQALENNLRVKGHTLVWGKLSDHFKSPDLDKWLQAFPEKDRSDKLREVINDHIVTVLNHFRGRVHTWDCVNEPTSMYNPGKLENNVFMKYLGEDYIQEAFKLAHSFDPDLKLYLNEEFSDYKGKQAECFLALVKKLKDNNIPLHGIGIQSHILSNIDTSIIDLQNFIRKFTDMGLEVEITELDMRLRLFNAADDPYEAQGKYYARLIKACMSNPMCKGVTFWGFSDDRCWIDQMPFPKPNEPYLFDAEMNPKPAFYEIYKMFRDAFNNKSITFVNN